MIEIFPYLAIALLLLAITLLVFARRQRHTTGLPAGRVIYTDTGGWGKLEKPLYDPALHLAGKPDYLLKQGSLVIPIEVKSSRAPEAPYDTHIFQLAAYCLLVMQNYPVRPPYGILNYPNRSYAIDFTPQLEASVVEVIHEMQALTARSPVDRSHESAQRCRHCGFRSICDQALRI